MLVSRKRTGHAVNQGGTADSVVQIRLYLFVLGRRTVLSWAFFYAPMTLKAKGAFLLEGGRKMLDKRWWRKRAI